MDPEQTALISYLYNLVFNLLVASNYPVVEVLLPSGVEIQQCTADTCVKVGIRKMKIEALPPGKFFMLFCRLLIFYKINFIEKFFQEYHLSVKQIGFLGPICLQRLSADDTRRLRINLCQNSI